ncbi:MAG: Ig-like domain-containing protein [Caldilineaceae bacterium]
MTRRRFAFLLSTVFLIPGALFALSTLAHSANRTTPVLAAPLAGAPSPTVNPAKPAGQATPQAAAQTCVDTGGSYHCTIAATLTWQQTPLTLNPGDLFSIWYTGGFWTVDNRDTGYPSVGPEGYTPDIDSQIPVDCKFDTSSPYAKLLGQIGNGPVFPFHAGVTFTANASGALFLRINDQDGCLGDNGGALELTVRYGILYSLIAGRVTDANNNPLADVTLSFASGTTTTSTDGTYSFGDMEPGAYTITAAKAGYTFAPASRTVTVPPDGSGIDFIGASVGFSCNNVTEIPVAECNALVALYNSTNGPNWLNHTDWLATLTPCSWFGVICFNGHADMLNLPNNQLNGNLPAQLGDISQMLAIYMAGNQLSGGIPPQLGNLTRLIELDLTNNQLSGNIPPELGNLTNLAKLHLASNHLNGSIPTQLGNLRSLVLLNLCCNQLSGNIPSQLGNLTSLSVLHLSGNQLSGGIPSQFGNLTRLTELGLCCNQLSGNLPAQVGNLTNLTFLSLDNNQLSGNLPTELGNLINLTALHVEINQLSGALPNSLTNLHKLATFWFFNTSLCEPNDPTFQGWLASIGSVNGTGPCSTNNPPVANDQSVTTAQNTAVNITLTASDADNDPLTYSIVSNPSHGGLSGAPPNLTYTPNAGFSGSDSFTFKVNDGKADSNIATVNITVRLPNYVLTFAIVGKGTVTLNPPGGVYAAGTPVQLSATPDPGFTFIGWSGAANGNANPLTVTMDGNKQITVNFNPVNSAPVANPQSVTVEQNTAVNISLTATDADNDPLAYILVSNPSHGILSGAPPNVIYTPNAGFSGTDSFTFKVNDSKTDSNVAIVNIIVIPSQQAGATLYLPLVMAPLAPIIPATTNILTEATTQFLTSISNDGTFTFRQMTPELANVAPGEVIVGGVNASAPYGFLRKVTTIANTGGQVIVQTVATTLEEAIEQGEVYVNRTLSPADVQNTVLASGVTLSEQGKFFLEIKDVVLYDADGNRKTTNDQVRANGSITLEPSFDFGFAIRQSKLERLHFTHTVKRTLELSLEAKATTSLLKQEVEVARYNFAPITVIIGVVPIVFTPVLVVNVGVDGSVYIGVDTGVAEQTSLTAGVRYEDGNWKPISEFTKSFQPNLPTLSSGLDLKGYAGAQLALMLYGVVGPHVDVNAYLKLEANPTVTPWWKLYAGLEVPVGIEFTIFSHVVAGYQATLIDYKVLLAQASTITRVSITPDNTEGNNASDNASISADGRYIAFLSSASNLVNGDTNNTSDIFVYDQQTSETTRVSVATNGNQGDNESGAPSISADGRYVAFESSATNLVSGDTNSWDDVFVYDRQTGEMSRVSVATDSTQGNNGSGSPSISADGRYVAFDSSASNLVSGDTNGVSDIFVHDRQTGETSRVSVATNGAQSDNRSYYASISADGRYVAFESSAGNLVSGDTNGWDDIFVHDRQTGETSRVSVATNGTQGDYLSAWPSISADGRYVAFLSRASNLVSGDTNGASDIFVRDRQTGQTSRVSVATNGSQGNDFSDAYSSISADGRYVVFASLASNLVSGDTNSKSDLFIHDRQTGQTSRVSVATDGSPSDNASGSPSISADGHYVAFTSAAGNLVSSDTNDVPDVFVYDRGN